MEKQNKSNPNKCSIEKSTDGSYKLSGPENFVNSKYEEIKRSQEQQSQELSKERCTIAFILIFVALIIFFLAFGFSGFPIKDYLIIFSAGIIGSAFRAKFLGKDIKVNKTSRDLWLAYCFIYPVLIFVISFLILAIFTQQSYPEKWMFYSVTLPVSFLVGTMGLAAVDLIQRKIQI